MTVDSPALRTPRFVLPVRELPSLTALEQLINATRPTFDSVESMLKVPFSSPGYHTTLTGGTVHPTRESLWYAVALLDTEGKDDCADAMNIFEKVLTLQDIDSDSRTYGIWPWFLEEPLSQMSPPDWNWADFCGSQLLEAMLTHRHCFPREIADKMDAAIIHAANSIVRRNVGPDYTNIAIMGGFVTLVAAELYDIESLHRYALDRLRKLHAYTRDQGGFSEYNSPTYTVVALHELARLLAYTQNSEAREIAEDLYQRAWEEIACHFHVPSQQWAGPHSRTYSTFLSSTIQNLIRSSTSQLCGEERKLSLGDHRLQHRCPEYLRNFFVELPEARTERKCFLKQEIDVVGTTYLGQDFSLGSINHGEFWNQRRALLAYWGLPESPKYLHARFLHDGYDFSSARISSVQQEGRVLAGIYLPRSTSQRYGAGC
jgi:hypothetical protein